MPPGGIASAAAPETLAQLRGRDDDGRADAAEAVCEPAASGATAAGVAELELHAVERDLENLGGQLAVDRRRTAALFDRPARTMTTRPSVFSLTRTLAAERNVAREPSPSRSRPAFRREASSGPPVYGGPSEALRCRGDNTLAGACWNRVCPSRDRVRVVAQAQLQRIDRELVGKLVECRFHRERARRFARAALIGRFADVQTAQLRATSRSSARYRDRG